MNDFFTKTNLYDDRNEKTNEMGNMLCDFHSDVDYSNMRNDMFRSDPNRRIG